MTISRATTKRNILANYVGQAASILVPVVALPFYLSHLGLANWGLVSVSMLIQSVLAIFGAGMSQATVRETTLRSVGEPDNEAKIAGLLRGLEAIYWVSSAACAVVIIAASPWLADYLIRPAPESGGEVIVILSALMFIAQFAGGPYKSILYATGRQVQSNRIMTVWLLVRHAAALSATYVSGTALAYLLAMTLSMFLELHAYFRGTWASLPVARRTISLELPDILGVLKTTAPLTLAVTISMLTMQVDKWLVATTLSAEDLGTYTIATMLGWGVVSLFNPIASALQPVIIRKVGKDQSLRTLNLQLLAIYLAATLLLIAGYGLVGEYALLFWLKNKTLAQALFPVAGVLMLGSGLNAAYNIGYMNWLAKGSVRKILIANALSLFIAVTVLPFAVRSYGLLGASSGWLLTNALCLALSLDWLWNRSRNA